MKRKSLADALSPDALSPEAREFLEAGTPQPQSRPSEAAPKPPVAEKAPRPKQRTEAQEPEGVVPLITQSYRLPVALVSTLMRASMERKIARLKPWSQQAIVTEAVTKWLQTHASK
jgi:hypothetical protein